VRRGRARARARIPLRDRPPARRARLGYPPADLDRIPAAAIDSFAGVGYFLDLAAITPGETVLDLGSGSGTDSLLAALATGNDGHVIGVDMTRPAREVP
jgi:arsenite methyltransferase